MPVRAVRASAASRSRHARSPSRRPRVQRPQARTRLPRRTCRRNTGSVSRGRGATRSVSPAARRLIDDGEDDDSLPWEPSKCRHGRIGGRPIAIANASRRPGCGLLGRVDPRHRTVGGVERPTRSASASPDSGRKRSGWAQGARAAAATSSIMQPHATAISRPGGAGRASGPRPGRRRAPGRSPSPLRPPGAARELELPAPPERDRREREVDRSLPGVEEDQEGVVDHRRAARGQGRDLGAVEEDAERERVVVAPVPLRHLAAVRPEPPDVGRARAEPLLAGEEVGAAEDRVPRAQVDQPLREREQPLPRARRAPSRTSEISLSWQ